MTVDEYLTRQQALARRAESLRLARERATTQGERDLYDEVEAQLREDVRRFAADVRADSERQPDDKGET